MHIQPVLRPWPLALLIITLSLSALSLMPGEVYAAKSMSDQALASAVRDRLVWDPGVEGLLVNVRASNGVVTLKGRSTNVGAKRLARNLTEQVDGVRRVVDQIQVDPLSLNAKTLKSDVQAALKADGDASHGVQVSVDGPTVTLSGHADSQAEKLKIGRAVSQVDGVAAVYNGLRVASYR